MDKQRVEMYGVKYQAANGLEFTLMWTNKGLAKAEELGLHTPNCGPNRSALLLLYALLTPLHPELSLDEVSYIIDMETAKKRVAALSGAMEEAQQKAQGDFHPKQPETQPPTAPL